MADHTTGLMAGKTVLVTDGTSGIGRATAAGLAALGARVGIIGRDLARTRAAAADIIATSGNPAVDAFASDLSSQAAVRRLAREVLDAYPRLAVLINNVGGFWATRRVTADGLEHTFAVNHLAGFLLTDLLLDRLKAGAPARIVTVSSGAHATGKMNFDDLQGERSYSGQQAYSQSKLANVLFTYELARHLEGSGVSATVLHPGVVRTGFAAEDPSSMWKVLLPLIRPFLKSPEKGAATSIYLASSAQVECVTAKYFANRKAKSSSKSSYDEAGAVQLWRISADLIGRTVGVYIPSPASPPPSPPPAQQSTQRPNLRSMHRVPSLHDDRSVRQSRDPRRRADVDRRELAMPAAAQTNTASYVKRPEGRAAYEMTGTGRLVVPGMGGLRAAYRFLREPLMTVGFSSSHRAALRETVGWDEASRERCSQP